MPAPKSSLRTNKTHKLINAWDLQRLIVKFLIYIYIFKNKQPKPYQSSKILIPNEQAQRKKKKERKIAKNSWEMSEKH